MGKDKAKGAGVGVGDTWFSRNEKSIRWGTMLGAWAVGIACIAVGIGVAPGMAIIAAGSAYAGAKPAVGWLKRRTNEKHSTESNGE